MLRLEKVNGNNVWEMLSIAGFLMNRRTRWQQSYTVHLDSRKPETWMGKN